MNYEDWVKMFQNPSKINWAEPLTEEERIKIESQLPKIAQVLVQEQKQLRQIKKLADKYERVAAAKDSETSKERMKMRLRKKLADKKETMAKEGISHLCTEECERRQKKRAMKLAAKRKLKAEQQEAEELLRRNRKEEDDDDLLQYIDLEQNNDEEEEEEDCQNGEGADNNDGQDDGEGFNAAIQLATPQPRDYSSSTYAKSNLTEELLRQNREEEEDDDLLQYIDPEQNNDEEGEAEDCQNGEGAENNDGQDDGEGFNAAVQHAMPQPRDYSSSTYAKSNLTEEQHLLKMHNDENFYDEQNVTDNEHDDYDADGEDEDKIYDLQMKFLAMSKGPQHSHGKKVLQSRPGLSSIWSANLDVSDDFSKFLNRKYHF